MRENLTKAEVKTVGTAVLNMRYCWLMLMGEALPANEITIADAREILWIEDELHRRLIKAVGHDFYPPDRVEKIKPAEKLPSNCIKSLLAPSKPKSNIGRRIKFNVVITSSLGCKVAEFSVDVDTKLEADKKARQTIRQLGLQRVAYKIS